MCGAKMKLLHLHNLSTCVCKMEVVNCLENVHLLFSVYVLLFTSRCMKFRF